MCPSEHSDRKKKCYYCEEWLDASHFTRDRSKKDGLRTYCRDCDRLKIGRKKAPDPVFALCAWCGDRFRVKPSAAKINKKGNMFCCREHFHAHQKAEGGGRNPIYRPAIIERDGGKCVLCGSSGELHVHHIRSRGSGGTNEYRNLVTLCGGVGGCHTTKAHGIDAAEYKRILEAYTSQFHRPDDWDIIMRRSAFTLSKYREKQRARARARYWKIKNSPQYKLYKRREKERVKRRDAEYRARFGVSYATYWARQAKLRRQKSTEKRDDG